jgi:16S rRNA (cytidine1402-2'-O)-methyltransferase
MSTLYLVATPIGNLEDISQRALRTLKEVKLIACEDTRHTAKLLNHYKISTPTTSFFEHNKIKKIPRVIETLATGDIALVSDAGTPGLNDPGYLLVKAAVEAGHNVSPIPGPTAPIAALVSSGLPTDKFLYLGYLPRKSGERVKMLGSVKELPFTLIFFEAPHRIEDSFQDLLSVLGDRQIAVAAELTKMYEEIFRGSISEAIKQFEKKPARGEYTLVIEGFSKDMDVWGEEKMQSMIKSEVKIKIPPSQLAKELSLKSGWPRRAIYNLIKDISKQDED